MAGESDGDEDPDVQDDEDHRMTRCCDDGEGALIVDLRSHTLTSSEALWEALMEPCGLPSWFGRNLNAWWDTIDAGCISEVIDEHALVVVLVAPGGIFAPGDDRGVGFLEVTNRSAYGLAEVRPPDPD